MAEEQEQEDNYNSIPYESFIEDQIFIDYEDEKYEKRDSEITTKMAERGTEITETETETSSYFSANNSTTTLEHHLKAKHFDVYKDLSQVESNAKPWTVDIQQEKHNFLLIGLSQTSNHLPLLKIK
ncbi:hypothetical protein RhiirC2_803740, partial [Rhizophagus irregularis]